MKLLNLSLALFVISTSACRHSSENTHLKGETGLEQDCQSKLKDRHGASRFDLIAVCESITDGSTSGTSVEKASICLTKATPDWNPHNLQDYLAITGSYESGSGTEFSVNIVKNYIGDDDEHNTASINDNIYSLKYQPFTSPIMDGTVRHSVSYDDNLNTMHYVVRSKDSFTENPNPFKRFRTTLDLKLSCKKPI